MAIDFPSAPTLNQTYTYAGRTWKWNGEGWQLLTNAIGDLILTSDDGGAAVGPTATFYRNSATPAASDLIGGLIFQGEDSAGNTQTYAQIAGVIEDPTSTSEDGAIAFYATSAGTLTERMQVTSTGLSVTGSSIFRAASTQDGIAIVGRAGGTSSYEVTLTPTTLSADQTQTLQNATGTVALSSNKLSFFAATTSAELAGVISDETGSGALVFATSPTLTTPVIGAATGTSLGLTGGSLTVRAAATQDGVIISGRAGGTSDYDVTLTPATLSNDRIQTLQDAAGTVALSSNKLSFFSATTSAELAGVVSDETGSGALVFATSPTLTTPTLGVASATSINKVAITAPATSATLTIANSKTLTVSNTLTFTGTDSSSVAFGTGGTVAYTGGTLAQFAATTSLQLAGVISDETGSGALVFGTSPAITTSLTTPSTSFDLLNTTATTVNFAGAATAMTVGASGGNAYFPTAITIGANNNLISGTQLQVNGSAGFAQIISAGDGQNGIISSRSYSASGLPLFQSLRSRGSYASNTAIADTDTIGEWRSLGYDGAAYRNMARVVMVADGTISGTSTPSKIDFYTTPASTTTATLKMTLKPTGQLLVGTTGGDNAVLELANSSNTYGANSRVINASSVFGAGVTSAVGVRTALGTTVGSAVTDLYHFAAGVGTLNVAPTTQIGFLVSSGLTGATNNYGFLSNIASAANTWNFYAQGTAQSHFTGAVSMGTATSVVTGHQLQINSDSGFAAATVAGDGVDSYVSIRGYGTSAVSVLQSIKARGTYASPTIVSDNDVLGDWNALGYNGTVYGNIGRVRFEVDGTTSASSLPSRVSLWTTPVNSTTIQERLRITDAGQLLFGATSASDAVGIRLARSITGAGATIGYHVYVDPTVLSDVTATALNVTSFMNTQAASFTLASFRHYTAAEGSIGAGSTVTAQFGYITDALLSATTNYGFYTTNSAAITAGKTHYGFYGASNNATGGGAAWNFYAAGTAPNHFAGITAFNNPTLLSVRSGVTPHVQVNNDGTGLGIFRFSNNTSSPLIEFFKSRSGTIGTQTIVQVGDALGGFRFNGSDGTNGQLAAEIYCVAANTPTANTDVPGALVFATTPDGSTSPTTRFFINSNGYCGFGAFSVSSGPQTQIDSVNSSTTDFQIAQFRSTAAASGTSWTYVNIRKDAGSASAFYGGAVGGYIAQGVGSGLGLFTYSGTATPTEGARLTSGGFFGIGLTNPFTTLHPYKNISGGSPATSGTTDANVITRIQGGSVGFDIGGTTAGAQWVQPRLVSDLSTNYSLNLCPNGGNVVIGAVGAGAYQLVVNTDSAAKPTTNTWTIASDGRLKDVVREYEKGLADICALRPIVYKYNGRGGFPIDDKENISVIAQEAMEVFPECVGTYRGKLDEGDTEDTDIYNWNGHAVTFALINAVRELSDQITALTSRLEALEAQ